MEERVPVPEPEDIADAGPGGSEGPQEIVDAARDELANPADESNEG